jgi:XTP/dITP diphosphohydrolase
MRLLLASRNAGKLSEFRDLLPEHDLLPWPKNAPGIPEDGAFFRDNAAQKADFARAWWSRHGDEAVDGVLADDSGLCVEALYGGPGVLSARFARELEPDEKNRALLAMLPGDARRNAAFVCVLAFAPCPAGELVYAEGTVEGKLSLVPAGTRGFGYDPIFVPKGYRRTFAQLGNRVKSRLSHRARACAALRELLA